MYAIITKIDSTEIELSWLSEKTELTDGTLVCQEEQTITTFDEFNSVSHKLTEVESLPEDFTPETFHLLNGVIVKK
tara:strand:+ start:13781 stop:14008 length:228 start_codon:yes stop_codon:yes gene_type:complete